MSPCLWGLVWPPKIPVSSPIWVVASHIMWGKLGTFVSWNWVSSVSKSLQDFIITKLSCKGRYREHVNEGANRWIQFVEDETLLSTDFTYIRKLVWSIVFSYVVYFHFEFFISYLFFLKLMPKAYVLSLLLSMHRLEANASHCCYVNVRNESKIIIASNFVKP